MKPEGLVEIELDRQGFYAGDHLRTVIKLSSVLKRNIRVFAAQITGFLLVSKEIVDEKKFEVLKGLPGYSLSGNGMSGGGRITNSLPASIGTVRMRLWD